MNQLTFREYSLPYNPRMLQVEHQRRLSLYYCPGGGEVIQDCGPRSRVVRGEGELFGPGAQEALSALLGLFAQGGAGTLILPCFGTMQAHLSALTVSGEGGEDVVRYSFEFLEALSAGGAA